MPKKNNKKQPSEKPSAISKKQKVLRWLLTTSLKLFLVCTLALAIYAIYLDSKVRKTFEGQRWQVPVQVYGATPQFFLGAGLNLSSLKQTLMLSGYQKVATVHEPGQFALSAKRIIIYRKAFDFGYDLLPAKVITIDIENGMIDRIWADEQLVAEVRLAPVLIDRILPENKEDRVLLKREDVPEQLIDMLLMVEDRDFYFHYGISPVGIARALISNIKAGRTVQGGSTLTQQLVKNMYLTRDKTIWRKFNEAIMALILEYRYSKDQLLEAYLNEVYLGQHYANGVYGFGLAAEFYFGKAIADLSLEQMATLVGQIKGPSYYDPWRYPERTIKRRDLVLALMFDQQYLSKKEYQQAVNSPLSVRKSRRIVKQKQPAYLQLVKRDLSQYLSEQEQQSGVKVFTSFDIRQQHLLSQAISQKLSDISTEKDMQAAMIVSDYRTGEVLAIAGGKDTQYAGFNRALHAKRPIGSLVKPMVYLAALERSHQYQLGSVIDDKPLAIEADNGTIWRPKNFDGKFAQQTSIYHAIVRSLNVPTVNLGLAVGLENIRDVIDAFGYQHEIELRPSILLGALTMSPYEIHQLYLPIAGNGIKTQSHAIKQIVAEDGEILWQFDRAPVQILSQQSAYLMKYALNGVTKEGSAKSLLWRLPNVDIAGKTGTSNDQRDSWFVGYDDNILVTTWLGRDDNKQTALTGSSGALVLFADFMQKTQTNSLDLTSVNGIEEVWFNDKTGQAYQSRCANSSPYPATKADITELAKCTEKHEKDKSWFERWFGD